MPDPGPSLRPPGLCDDGNPGRPLWGHVGPTPPECLVGEELTGVQGASRVTEEGDEVRLVALSRVRHNQRWVAWRAWPYSARGPGSRGGEGEKIGRSTGCKRPSTWAGWGQMGPSGGELVRRVSRAEPSEPNWTERDRAEPSGWTE